MDTEDFFFIRPAAHQQIAVGKRQLPSRVEKLFPSGPKVGLVISTFGSPAYVDLALAIRARLYPDLPVLVHDDASDQTDTLLSICQKRGVLFQTNSSRLGHEMGDLSAIVGGLRWAAAAGVDLLVKMSRRFIPLVNWVSGLQQFAATTQYGTYGQGCMSYKLRLRTECFAMAVRPWSEPSVIDAMTEYMLTNRKSIFLEDYVLEQAGTVYENNCIAARDFERRHVRITPRPRFAGWEFLGNGRKETTPSHLWHETATPAKYADIARQLGLNDPAGAFAGFSSQAGV